MKRCDKKRICEAIVKLAECIDALEFPYVSQKAMSRDTFRTRKQLILDILNINNDIRRCEESI